MFWIAFRGLPDHLKIVSVLAVARWFLGTAFAVYLFMKVADLPVGTEADAAILLTVAWASFCLAQLRLVQALGARLAWAWTRRLGFTLAVFDCANLVFFPLSTALGFLGVVAYRHPDTGHYFSRR